MRIGMVTTSWMNQRCGVAEYSRMLIESLCSVASDIEVTPIFGPYEFNSLHPRCMAGKYDVIHFNYDSGFLGIFSPSIANRFRETGAKIVITLNDHHPRNNRSIFPFTSEFDRVVVHQETDEGFTFIPIGIDVLEDSPWSSTNTSIGTCGFPLGQKGIPLVAEAAAILARESNGRITGCTMVCPESQHIDTHMIGRQVKAIFPPTNYITSWLSQREVELIMAKNLVNVFPMRDGKSGISSSVRMAVACGSPMVLSNSWMFQDWRDYPKYAAEIEWAGGDANSLTGREVADAVFRVLENGKRPKEILKDFSWKGSARIYADMYRSLVSQQATA